MNNFHTVQDSSVRISAGVKTAVLVAVLGAIALFADASLVGPRDAALAAARGAAPVATAEASYLPPVAMPMIAWDRAADVRLPAGDPSVPSAESVAPSKVEPLPATF